MGGLGLPRPPMATPLPQQHAARPPPPPLSLSPSLHVMLLVQQSLYCRANQVYFLLTIEDRWMVMKTPLTCLTQWITAMPTLEPEYTDEELREMEQQQADERSVVGQTRQRHLEPHYLWCKCTNCATMATDDECICCAFFVAQMCLKAKVKTNGLHLIFGISTNK